jgi:hypothetical protein
MNKTTFVHDLRAMADFYEAHPDLPEPYEVTLNVFVRDRYDLSAIARMASWQKVWMEDWVVLRHQEGRVKLDIDIKLE